MRDLTERREAAERLRRNEESCRLFFENVRDHALFQVGPDGLISSWNAGAERLFGYTDEEIVGEPVSRLFPPDDVLTKYPQEELARALADGHVFDERWMVRRDGTRFFASWVTHPMFDEQGRLRGFAKVLRDRTEELRAQHDRERLQQVERELLNRQLQSTSAELDQTRDELRALAASLMTAQEDERRRLARDLHDDFAQRLAALEMHVVKLREAGPEWSHDWAAGIEDVRQQVASLSADVRSLSHRLHPSALEDLGLRVALQHLIEDFERAHELAVRFKADGLATERVPQSTASAIYRITQEALRTVVKHARDSTVTAAVSLAGNQLCLVVQDDGPGFDPAGVRTNTGLGLVSIRERAALAGGLAEIRSAPGNGTEIRVKFPLEH